MLITATHARFLGALPEDIEVLDRCQGCRKPASVWANDDLCVPCWNIRDKEVSQTN